MRRRAWLSNVAWWSVFIILMTMETILDSPHLVHARWETIPIVHGAALDDPRVARGEIYPGAGDRRVQWFCRACGRIW